MFTSEMNVIPLGGYDIILGVKWMTTVSPVTFDYKDHSILINWKDQKIKLQQSAKTTTIQLIPDADEQPKFH